MSQTKLRFLGNFCLLIGVAGLIFTFYPIIREELSYRFGQPQLLTAPDSGYSITIPSIRVSAPVIAGVDPFNRSEYIKALQQGIAQAQGTALPGQAGTQYLFAHSSDAPWRLSRYNTAFFRLNQVKPGDQILVRYRGNLYTYQVTGQKTVWPNDLSYLKDTAKNQLILQTCTPIGTDWKRLLVFAEPVS